MVYSPNLTDFGYSRDNLMEATLRMGAKWALVRNSPDFVRMARARGLRTIYRQANDDQIPADPVQFVRDRAAASPEADYIHLLNEVGFSVAHDNFNRAATLEAERLGRKVVGYNTATNASEAEWQSSAQTSAWMLARGHAIGVHIYFDGIHDAGAWGWLNLYKVYRGKWFITELGYIQTIFDAYRGWRGHIAPETYANLLRLWEIPADVESFIFSLEHWPNSDEGKRSGFAFFDTPAILDACAQLNKAGPVNIPEKTSLLYKAKMVLAGCRLRQDHSTNGVIIRMLNLGEVVTVYKTDPAHVQDGYAWWWVVTDRDQGWVASPVPNGDAFKPITQNVPIILHNPFQVPISITSRFGVPRTYEGKPMKHEGVDLVPTQKLCAPVVRACADGVVDKIAFNPAGYGNYIRLRHENGWYTWYGHLNYPPFSCGAGQLVKTGDIIGLMGSTGNSTGPHLHLTVQHEGFGITSPEYVLPDVVDPLSVLQF